MGHKDFLGLSCLFEFRDEVFELGQFVVIVFPNLGHDVLALIWNKCIQTLDLVLGHKSVSAPQEDFHYFKCAAFLDVWEWKVVNAQFLI